MAKVYDYSLINNRDKQKIFHLLNANKIQIDQTLKYALMYRVKITLKYYYRNALLNLSSHFVGVLQSKGEIHIIEASGYTIPLRNIVEAKVMQ